MITRTVSIWLSATAFLVAAAAAGAQTAPFRLLHAFDGQDGDEPTFLVQRGDGSLYGVTLLGGPTDAFNGVLYKIDPAGRYSVVHAFTDVPDGSLPGKLFLAGDGNLYGLTASGGAFSGGTVYRVDAADQYTLLHSFQGVEGTGPSFLLEASDGHFYGTTSGDGTPSVCTNHHAQGTLFRMEASGEVTPLHTFCEDVDGQGPSSLVETTAGTFYGTCFEDGPFDLGFGAGTFWKSNAAGDVTVLHVFGPRTLNGDQPTEPNGIVQASDGLFYGVANSGGADSNGAIFRIDAEGNVRTIHSFNGFATDGSDPESNFTLGPDGFFYGTASQGGLPVQDFRRAGVVYRADTAGHVWVLHTFTGDDGFRPAGTPVLGLSGNSVYATATFDGPRQHGITASMSLARTTPIVQLRFTPQSVVGGQSVQATLRLRTPAPPGGKAIRLFTSNSLDLPATVTVPEGERTATFTVVTHPSSLDYQATVTAAIRSLGMTSPFQVLATPQP